VPSRADRSRTLVQLEPIRTAATQAANAVGPESILLTDLLTTVLDEPGSDWNPHRSYTRRAGQADDRGRLRIPVILLRIRRAHSCKAGLPPRTPRRMGCRPRCFNPSLPTRHAAGSSLHQRGEDPAPQVKSTPPAGPPAQGWTGQSRHQAAAGLRYAYAAGCARIMLASRMS
jgi:hypothetical protein